MSNQENHILVNKTTDKTQMKERQITDDALNKCLDNLIAECKANHVYELFQDEGSLVRMILGKAMRLYRYEVDENRVYDMIIDKVKK